MFGCKVCIRQVHDRADGRYVRVQLRSGVVILMASWMFDPLACATMTAGPPRVDWAALIELKRLLIDVRLSKVSSTEAVVVQEDRDEDPQSFGCTAPTPSVELTVRHQATVRIECSGEEQGQADSGANPDAGRRPHGRGARR
jgi:hypothetical protein